MRWRTSGGNVLGWTSTGDSGWSEPGGDKKERVAARLQVVFTNRDQHMIRRYFQSKPGNRPPGFEKHFERHRALAPGLQKRVQPFPAALDRQLPRLPGGYARVILEGRAVILGPNSTIVDVLVIGPGPYHEHEREN